MAYALEFLPTALREWHSLDGSIRSQLKKKLAERLENPHVASARLHGASNRYKIKLRAAGYRLVYEVNDGRVTVTVIAIGRRDNAIYDLATAR